MTTIAGASLKPPDLVDGKPWDDHRRRVTSVELAALRELWVNANTGSPWEAVEDRVFRNTEIRVYGKWTSERTDRMVGNFHRSADGALVAAVVNLLPAIIAELEEARATKEEHSE